MYKVSMVSLGCPKNQVDAEMMLSTLKNAGFELCPEEAQADAIIIHINQTTERFSYEKD